MWLLIRFNYNSSPPDQPPPDHSSFGRFSALNDDLPHLYKALISNHPNKSAEDAIADRPITIVEDPELARLRTVLLGTYKDPTYDTYIASDSDQAPTDIGFSIIKDLVEKQKLNGRSHSIEFHDLRRLQEDRDNDPQLLPEQQLRVKSALRQFHEQVPGVVDNIFFQGAILDRVTDEVWGLHTICSTFSGTLDALDAMLKEEDEEHKIFIRLDRPVAQTATEGILKCIVLTRQLGSMKK